MRLRWKLQRPRFTVWAFVEVSVGGLREKSYHGACLFVSFELEHLRMTFQVGMRCAEGAVLCSDKKHCNLMGFRHGRIAPKIYVHESEGLAHCSSGDDLCNVFTEIVRQENRTKPLADRPWMEVKQVLAECVKQAKQQEAHFRMERAESRMRASTPQCFGGNTMLVFRGESICLWMVHTDEQVPWPILVDEGRLEIGGDASNSASFFLSHYYPQIDATVAAFLPLAAHTVLMAKGEFVEGLEIGVFTRERFGLLSEAELAPLIKGSDHLDDSILKAIKARCPTTEAQS